MRLQDSIVGQVFQAPAAEKPARSRLLGVAVMAEEPLNDNEVPDARHGLALPDAHGQTALLLVESLIHALIEKSALTVAEAVEIVATAAEIEEEVALEASHPLERPRMSQSLLQTLASSLTTEQIYPQK